MSPSFETKTVDLVAVSISAIPTPGYPMTIGR